MKDLLKKIESKEALIGVIGLGYVGIPLAKAFKSAGYEVLGFDTSAVKVEACGLDATIHMERLSEPDVLIICVPTPLTPTREPDLSHVMAVSHSIQAFKNPHRKVLTILESTTYPGTTRSILPLIGAPLVYSPEREDPGAHTIVNIPKVVGGFTLEETHLAQSLYNQITTTVPVSSPEVAEACKILENTYRAVNIALVNELKVLFTKMSIPIHEVIDAAATKPFGFQAFRPGPGLGGHCIPIDPFYLTWIARKYNTTTKFIELAGEINTAMPQYVVGRIQEALNSHKLPVNGSRIALLGIAYKKNVADTRESPAFPIGDALQAMGATVYYNDPHAQTNKYTLLHWSNISHMDCVVIVTDHDEFDYDYIQEHATLIVDTRNKISRQGAISA